MGTLAVSALAAAAAQYIHDPDPKFAITGSGPRGRVMRRDVERHLACAAPAGALVSHAPGATHMQMDPPAVTQRAEGNPPDAAPTGATARKPADCLMK